MSEFTGVPDTALALRLREVGTTLYGHILSEYVSRQIDKCRADLESADDLRVIHILQGRIAQLRELSRLLTSAPSGAATPQGV